MAPCRFWEHMIDDEEDFDRHFDYVHYNPLKHGLVNRVSDWPWSSFHRWVRAGIYPAGWGGGWAPPEGWSAAFSTEMERATGEP